MSVRAIAVLTLTAALLATASCQRNAAPPDEPIAQATEQARSAALSTPTSSPIATPAVQPQSPHTHPTAIYTDKGDLLITVTKIERHGVDLPTLLRATAKEMERDARIRLTAQRVDGDLATDGRPVAVIEYTVAAIEESTAGDGNPQQGPPLASAAFAGRQYAAGRRGRRILHHSDMYGPAGRSRVTATTPCAITLPRPRHRQRAGQSQPRLVLVYPLLLLADDLELTRVDGLVRHAVGRRQRAGPAPVPVAGRP